MKKNLIRISMSLVIMAAMLIASSVCVFAAATPHYIMTSPDFSATSGKFNGFMIDFMTDEEDFSSTYWGLANYKLDNSATWEKLGYTDSSIPCGIGGFASYRDKNDIVFITSIPKYDFYNKETQKEDYFFPWSLYPGLNKDQEDGFCPLATPYAIKPGHTYRLLVLCWEDEELGRTFVGNWIHDVDFGYWNLMSVFNTGLEESFFTDGFSQFMECLSVYNTAPRHSFCLSNFYVLDRTSNGWVSTPTIHISSDDREDFIGTVGGKITEDGKRVYAFSDFSQTAENYEPLDITVTLDQDEKPTLGKGQIQEIHSRNQDDKTTLYWSMDIKSAPQLSYRVSVVDGLGNEVFTKLETRPYVREISFDEVTTETFTATLTVTDVFGNEISETCKGSGKGEIPDAVVTPEPSESETPEKTEAHESTLPTETQSVTTAPETKSEEKSDNTPVIVIVCSIIGAALIAALVVNFIKKSKKKTK